MSGFGVCYCDPRGRVLHGPTCPECGGRGVVTYPLEGDDDCPACGPAEALTVRPAETQAERDLDIAMRIVGLLLTERAARDAYDATEGRPWGERIPLKARWDAAREATAAEMTGTTTEGNGG